MRVFNVENVKMLDGMHEGLLILTKSSASTPNIMFCNRSAEKLLSRAMRHQDAGQAVAEEGSGEGGQEDE